MTLTYSKSFLTSLRRMSALICTIAALCVATSSCGNHSEADHQHAAHEAAGIDDHDGHDHEAELAGHGDSSDEISFPAAHAKAAGVETMKVAPGEFTEVIATSGRIIAGAGAESTAVATQAGIIRLAHPWTEGQPVANGSTVAYVSNSRLPEGDLASRAKIEFQKAQQEFSRAEKLMADHLITAQEFENAKAAYQSAKLSYEATGSGKSNGAAVIAPKSGYVLQCLVKDGDYVEVGAPVMTIVQNRRLQLQADLPLRESARIGDITSANFRLSGNREAYNMRNLNGRIISRGTQSAQGTSFIPVIFEFDAAPGIAAGAFAEVYLLGAKRQGVISVPSSALTEEQGVKCVYVQLDPDCYERRIVSTGATDGSRVEILSGLHEGETIVSRGAIHVKLASASKAIPGHTHNH